MYIIKRGGAVVKLHLYPIFYIQYRNFTSFDSSCAEETGHMK